jgi:hypothetical protein
MFVNLLLRALAFDLEARGIRDPLRQYFRYADLWAELARLQQEPLPADVLAITKEPPFLGLEEPAKEEP